MLGLSQATYINQILARFKMVDSNKGFIPFKVGISLPGNQRPKTPAEIERMRGIPYASAMGSLKYVMLCIRLDICFAIGMISRY